MALFGRKPKATKQAALTRRTPGSAMTLHTSDELQREFKRSMKSAAYSSEVMDFINDNAGGGLAGDYNDHQLDAAYRTSGYLFSCLRLVAQMMSSLPVAGERHTKGDTWERLPEAAHLNQMIKREGRSLLWEMYMYRSLFGKTMAYKRKTRKAVIADQRDRPIYKYGDGAVYGLHAVPNHNWTLDEDGFGGEIKGFFLAGMDDDLPKGKTYLHRHEVVYHHDFDTRRKNDGIPMVSLALNNAVTDAAIARWAAHYFMSGAMPLLLISTEDDDSFGNPADESRFRNLIERQWQGMWSRLSLRAVFTNRKLNVQQAGIDAEKVQAPDLDQTALNKIASIVGIAPDLIVPPAGGSDNARHKYLIKQAYEMTVIPTANLILEDIARDLYLEEAGMRLVVAEEDISALEADRGDVATTELSLFSGGVQGFKETRERVNLPAVPEGDDIFIINGKPVSIKKLLRENSILDYEILQYAVQAWDGGVFKRDEMRAFFGLPPGGEDGYKYELVPDPGAGGGDPFGGGSTPPQLPQGPNGDAPGDGSAVSSAALYAIEPDDPLLEDDEWEFFYDDGDFEELSDDAEAEPEPSDTVTIEDGERAPVEQAAADDTDDTPLAPEPESLSVEPVSDGTALAPVETEAEREAQATAPDPAFAYLHVGNDLLVATVAERVREQLAEAAVEWSDPETWHVTLVYAPDADDEALERARALLPDAFDRLALQVDGLVTFDVPSGYAGRAGVAICLAVELDSRLEAFQAQVRGAFDAQGLSLSPYSLAGAYTPHITLGYAPAEAFAPPLDAKIVVHPVTVRIARGEFDVLHEIPLTSDWRAAQAATADVAELDPPLPPESDLEGELAAIERDRRTWKDALQHWSASGAHPATLPERIVVLVVAALERAGAPGEAPPSQSGAVWNRVFATAIACCEAGALDEYAPVDPNPITEALEATKAMQQTPDQELAAWENFTRKNGTLKAIKRFEVKTLPLALEQQVRADLEAATGKEGIRAVFAQARKALEDQAPRPIDEDAFAALAERLAASDDLDLQALLGNVPGAEEEATGDEEG